MPASESCCDYRDKLIELPLHPDVAAFSTHTGLEDPAGVVLPQQTHTVNVGILTSPGMSFPQTDALITQLRGVAIGVRTADCVPLLLYAPDIKAIAAVHAGWKGSLYGIAGNTVSALRSLGADTARIRAVFGAAICGECYEVSPELADDFRHAGFGEAVTDYCPRPHIDLVEVNRLRLIAEGVPAENIVATGMCTRHSADASGPLFHSWRRDNGTPLRNITFARLK